MKRVLITGLMLLCPLLLSACGGASGRPAAGEALPGEAIPLLEPYHIATMHTEHEPYNSVPPTSGPHVHHTVATGTYREEIPEEIQVHVLEHGHVIVQYAPDTVPADVKELEGLARQYPRDVVVAPYSKLSHGIALTAWGRLLRLESAELDQIEAFIQAHRGRYDHGWQE